MKPWAASNVGELNISGAPTSKPHHGCRIKSGKSRNGEVVMPSPQPSPTGRGSFWSRSPIGFKEYEKGGVPGFPGTTKFGMAANLTDKHQTSRKNRFLKELE